MGMPNLLQAVRFVAGKKAKRGTTWPDAVHILCQVRSKNPNDTARRQVLFEDSRVKVFINMRAKAEGANDAVLDTMAQVLSVPKTGLSIGAGQNGQAKTLLLHTRKSDKPKETVNNVKKAIDEAAGGGTALVPSKPPMADEGEAETVKSERANAGSQPHTH